MPGFTAAAATFRRHLRRHAGISAAFTPDDTIDYGQEVRDDTRVSPLSRDSGRYKHYRQAEQISREADADFASFHDGQVMTGIIASPAWRVHFRILCRDANFYLTITSIFAAINLSVARFQYTPRRLRRHTNIVF